MTVDWANIQVSFWDEGLPYFSVPGSRQEKVKQPCIERFSLPYCKGAPKDPKAHALNKHLQKNGLDNHQASTPLLFGRSMSPELLYSVSSSIFPRAFHQSVAVYPVC